MAPKPRPSGSPARYSTSWWLLALLVSQGYAVSIDPAAWTLYEGRLYLN